MRPAAVSDTLSLSLSNLQLPVKTLLTSLANRSLRVEGFVSFLLFVGVDAFLYQQEVCFDLVHIHIHLNHLVPCPFHISSVVLVALQLVSPDKNH